MQPIFPRFSKLLRLNERGAVAVLVAVSLAVLLMFASLSVDVSYLFVIRNQLQNAADGGTLAAARELYTPDGQAVNAGANGAGYDVAVLNEAQNEPVEVQDPDSNAGDVQRGHWSFATRTFTPNDSLAPVSLADVSTEELDANTDFINATRVRTRRETIPAQSFLARLLGYDSFDVHAEAIAYLGFAGTLASGEADQPIAVCRQSILDQNGDFTCTTGRMIDSGSGDTHNSAGWSNWSQPCETASASSVRPLICSGGNPNPIKLGEGIGTVGGMQTSGYNDFRTCWLNQPDLAKGPSGTPIQSWNQTFVVIDCEGNNVAPCSTVVGAVSVNILYVKQSGADPNYLDIPLQMDGWTCSLATPTTVPSDLTLEQRQQCFQEFATSFQLLTATDAPVSTLTASELQKTIFFKPDCDPHVPVGGTGGQNFGVLAKIPVLVN